MESNRKPDFIFVFGGFDLCENDTNITNLDLPQNGGRECQGSPNRCPGSLALLGHGFVLVQVVNVQNFKTVSLMAVFLKKYANRFNPAARPSLTVEMNI